MARKKNQDQYRAPGGVRAWKRFSNACLAGAAAMVYVAFTESYGFEDVLAYLVMAALLVLGFVGCRKLSKKSNFKGLKKYYIGKGIDQQIRQDSGDMSFSISIYNSLPCTHMQKWIAELNPAAGEAVAAVAADNKK